MKGPVSRIHTSLPPILSIKYTIINQSGYFLVKCVNDIIIKIEYRSCLTNTSEKSNGWSEDKNVSPERKYIV